MFKFVFLVLVLYLAVLYNKKRKGSWTTPSMLLLFLYFASAVACLPTVYYNYHVGAEDYSYALKPNTWPGVFIFIFYLYLYLYPFCYFNESKVQQIVLPNIRVLNRISSILICLSLFSIIHSIPLVIRVFTSGDLSALRNMMGSGDRSDFSDTGILNTISSVSSSLYAFAILFFFIYFIIGGHKKRIILLLISSTSYIFYCLTFVGRDGVVFWVFNIMFMTTMFKDYLHIRQLKKIRNVLIVSSFIAVLPFLAISISRFAMGNGGTGGGMLSYFGQMPANYAMYYNVAEKHYSYGSSFPLYWEITRQQPPKKEDRWVDGGTESNVFGTFIKEFNVNFGLWGTVLVGIITMIFFLCVFGRYRKKIYFYHFFIYILYWSVFSEGLFYFKHGTRGGNLFILLCLGLYYYFYFLMKNGRTYILQKPEKNDDLWSRSKFQK